MKRRHQVNHDMLLTGLPRRRRRLVIWSASVVAAFGLTGALAMPIVAQPADPRQGNVPVAMNAISGTSFYHAPVVVSPDAPLNAFGASGKRIAIDGRPVGMLEGASAASETTNGSHQSAALLAGTVGELGKLPGQLQLMHPVKTRRISSPYGWRANPTGAGNQIHIGQDYPIACGSPVYASEAGTVTVSSWAGHSGMRVTIDHGYNVQTGYSHNSKLLVNVGQQVQQGELIALAGTTGNSTGCHVHFEVIIDGRWHDPRNYLPAIAGQRQAMINSQRLTVNAKSAPEGNGVQSPEKPGHGPDPDIVVPEDDTPVIPGPEPSPSKPLSPSPNETQSPRSPESVTPSKSPESPRTPEPSQSQTPKAPQSPEPTQPTQASPSGDASQIPSTPETETPSPTESVTPSPTATGRSTESAVPDVSASATGSGSASPTEEPTEKPTDGPSGTAGTVSPEPAIEPSSILPGPRFAVPSIPVPAGGPTSKSAT